MRWSHGSRILSEWFRVGGDDSISRITFRRQDMHSSKMKNMRKNGMIELDELWKNSIFLEESSERSLTRNISKHFARRKWSIGIRVTISATTRRYPPSEERVSVSGSAMTLQGRRLQDSLSMTTTVITQCISRLSLEKMRIRSRLGQDSSMHGFVSLSRRGFAISPSISCVSDEVRASKNDIPNSRRTSSNTSSVSRKRISSCFNISPYYLTNSLIYYN